MNFPSICVSNFFTDPQKILKLAKEVDYYPNNDGSYPGVRSRPLHLINYDLFNKFIIAVLNNFYSYQTKINFEAKVMFHKIKPFSKNKKDIRNRGWIHTDEAACALAGLVYLNEKADLDTGTSTFMSKNNLNHDWSIGENLKVNLYLNGIYNKKKYEKEMNSTDSKFIKKLEFNNIFNTLVCYDSMEYHRINNLNIGTGEDRLTLVFFITNLIVDESPLNRIRNIFK